MLPEALMKHLIDLAARCSSPSTFRSNVLVLLRTIAAMAGAMLDINADLHIGRSWSRYARWRRGQRIERARVRRAKRGHR